MRHPNRINTVSWVIVGDEIGGPNGAARVYRVPTRQLGGEAEHCMRQMAEVIGFTLVIAEAEPAQRSAKAVLADLLEWRGESWPEPQPDWVRRAIYRR